MIGSAAVIALAIAGFWQMAASGEDDPQGAYSIQGSSSTVSESTSSQQSNDVSSNLAAADKPEADPASSDAGDSITQGALPKAQRVKSDYFDDAAFIGDSLTTGIFLYDMMPNADVYAETGVSTLTFHTAAVIKQEDGNRITIPQALEGKEYKKLYLMLGGNDSLDSPDAFVGRYGKVIDTLRQLQPDAILYVQSILPVTEDNIYNLTNEHIDSFNDALIDLCREKGVYYVDVAQALKDETGALPNEASPADGMHFDTKYYTKWMDYLKEHTAPAV